MKNKIKKRHPVRNTIIIVSTVLIVAPVAFVFGAFYDPSHKKTTETYENYQDHMLNLVATGMNNINEENGVFKMTFDQDFLNSVLAYASKTLLQDPKISKYVKNIYVTIKGNDYKFYVDLQASFFKTKVCLPTTLFYDEANTTYTFKINNLILGRLPFVSLVKTLLPKFLSDDQINSALKSTGLNLNFSLKDMKITYKKGNIKEDLGNILEKFNTDTGLPLASVILQLYDLLEPSVTFDDGIGFSLNFNVLTERPQGITPPHNPLIDDESKSEYKNELTSYKTFVEQCLNEGLVTTEDKEGNYNTLFKYLLSGYNSKYETTLFSSSINPKAEELKAKIKSTFHKTYNEYTGSKFLSNKKLDNADLMNELKKDGFRTTISDTELNNLLAGNSLDFCTISDSLLSNYLRSTDLMGYTFSFPIKIEDKYNFAYLTFDDFNVNINEGELDIFGNLNFNGLNIPLTMSNVISKNGKTISITPKSTNGVLIGKYDISSIKDQFFKFIGTGFSSGDLFKFNNDHFELDFSTFEIPNAGEYGQVTHFINAIIKGYYIDGEGNKQTNYTYSGKSINLEKFDLSYTTKNGNLIFSMNLNS